RSDRAPAAPGVALLRLVGILGERLQGFFRQPYLQQVPGRHRVITADHHHVGEHLFQRFGNVVTGRGGSADHPPQEPARAVHAQEPDRGQACRRVRARRPRGRDRGPFPHPQRPRPPPTTPRRPPPPLPGPPPGRPPTGRGSRGGGRPATPGRCSHAPRCPPRVGFPPS